jgi:hypothetical protein
MNCPAENTLRTYLDNELPPPEFSALKDHLAACAACQARFQALSASALRVRSRLASLDAPPSTAEADPHIALARFKAGLPSLVERLPFFARMFSSRSRLAWTASLATAIIAISLLFPATRGFAQRLLATLRVERVQTVSLDFGSLDDGVSHQPLETLAKMLSDNAVVTTNEKESSVDSRDAATQMAGFPVRLLAARADTPSFEVSGAHAFHLTLDRSRLQDVLDQAGRSDLLLPATLDGATVSVQVPRSLAVSYGNCKGERKSKDQSAPADSATAANPCLALIEAPSPVINVPSDLNLQQLAEIGLQLAGWNPVKAREFCQSVDWKSTLVLPIPRSVQSYETVWINGLRGTLLRFPHSDRPSYALIWVDGGIVYSLIGWSDPESAVQLASSLE